MKKRSLIISIVFVFYVISLFVCGSSFADCCKIKKAHGQTLFLPLTYYDRSYTNADGEFINARAVSRIFIRNTDPHNPITFFSGIVYSPYGEPLKNFFEIPTTIGPLASISIAITNLGVPLYSTDEGSISMILQWETDSQANQPHVTSSMLLGAPDGDGFKIEAAMPCQAEVMQEKTID